MDNSSVSIVRRKKSAKKHNIVIKAIENPKYGPITQKYLDSKK